MAKTKEEYKKFGHTQKEALINEYKGNLFEYLVAHLSARGLGIEERFLSDFGGVAKKRLSEYEAWLRQNDRELIQALPQLARPVADFIIKEFQEQKLLALLVVGKSAAGSSAKESSLKEADLLILLEGEKGERIEQGLSLKLCKANAFVNTKSGGLKSFFLTYFAECPGAKKAQEELLLEVERSFWQMGHELYESEGLGDFTGHFDERWRDAKLPELPGELPAEKKKLVQKNYQKLIKLLHRGFLEFQENDPSAFKRSLGPLMGLGRSGLIQLSCFYQNNAQARYQFDHLQEHSGMRELLEVSRPSILPLKKDLSSFEVRVADWTLQIRVKPMNKFTQASYKVNCSLKKMKAPQSL